VGIVAEDIERLRDSADIVAVVSEHVALRRVGLRYQGLCPFHDERTPSFTVVPDKRFYHCFGCQAHGSAIDFVMNVMKVDFVTACEHLASRSGITLRHDSEVTTRDRERKARLRAAMAKAVDWYHERLLSSPDAGPARSYLRSRGYGADLVRQFRIGWAPGGWDTLVRALNIPSEVARDTGLGFVNRVGKLNDFFQSRVLFPIFDANGEPIAFGGRKLPGAEGPKYKNSSETALYSKSKVLYGLNWAKGDIVAKGEVVVCEGYTDTIAFHQAGIPRAVATCGTALTEDHVRILKNYGRRIVLAYDADGAGQNAAARFYEWERRFELDLAVVALPEGADPADLARTDPEALRAAVGAARPYLAFRLDRLWAASTLTTAEGRGRAFEAAAAMIGEHPSPFVREDYLRQAADRCRVSEDGMQRALVDARSPAARPSDRPATTRRRGEPDDVPPPDDRHAPPDPDGRVGTAGGRGGPGPRGGFEPARRTAPGSRGARATSPRMLAAAARDRARVEQAALCWLIHQPEAVATWMDPALFAEGRCARVCEALLVHGDLLPAMDALAEQGDPEAEQLLSGLAATEAPGEAVDAVALLVRRAVVRVIDDLVATLPEGPEGAGALAAVGMLKQHMACLDEPETREASLHALVPWMVEHARSRAWEGPSD
jgi:DNA primase